MFKSIALLKCKEGLSRADFIDYYETQHAPLICSLLPQVCGYRRNFLRAEGAFINASAAEPDYDVITELWFADKAAYGAAMLLCADPVIAQKIADDEAHFLNRAHTRMFQVDEYCSVFTAE